MKCYLLLISEESNSDCNHWSKRLLPLRLNATTEHKRTRDEQFEEYVIFNGDGTTETKTRLNLDQNAL